MPLKGVHSCRLKNPDSVTVLGQRDRKHNGKTYHILFGLPKHSREAGSVEQAYRYPTDSWTEGDARSHCTSHNGILFESALSKKVEMAAQKLKNAVKKR